MATVTSKLPDKSIAWLQELAQINIDSRDGFRDAADNLAGKDSAVMTMFRNLADERTAQAVELENIVAANGETPKHAGSATAAAHRAWMDLRAALGGGVHAMLSEAERGEDYIKGKYESALQDLGNCSCTTVLRKQYGAIRSAHDRVRNLRDSTA